MEVEKRITVKFMLGEIDVLKNICELARAAFAEKLRNQPHGRFVSHFDAIQTKRIEDMIDDILHL